MRVFRAQPTRTDPLHAADALERSEKLKPLSNSAQSDAHPTARGFVNNTRACTRLARPMRPEPAVLPLHTSRPMTPADHRDANKHECDGDRMHLQPPRTTRPVQQPRTHPCNTEAGGRLAPA